MTMIQIQIATSLHEDGVGDIRWVLLDPSEDAAATMPAPAQRLAPQTAPVAAEAGLATAVGQQRQPAARTFRALRAVVLAAALAGVCWMASSVLAQRPPASSGSAAPSVPHK